MKTLSTPVAEQVHMRGEKVIDIAVDMKLASVPCVVTGSYNVGLNAFNPEMVNGELLDDLCEQMGWDEYETRNEIQEAFENR